MRAVVRWFGAHAAAQGCGYLLAWCSGVAQSNNRGLTAGQEHGMHEMNGCAPAGVRAPDLWSSAWADSRRALDGAGGAGEAKTREDLWSTSAGPQKKKDVLDAAQRSRAEDGACGRAARVEEGNLSTALQGGCWHTISTHQPAYRTRWHAADRAGGRQQAARSLSADDNARGGMPSAQQQWMGSAGTRDAAPRRAAAGLRAANRARLHDKFGHRSPARRKKTIVQEKISWMPGGPLREARRRKQRTTPATASQPQRAQRRSRGARRQQRPAVRNEPPAPSLASTERRCTVRWRRAAGERSWAPIPISPPPVDAVSGSPATPKGVTAQVRLRNGGCGRGLHRTCIGLRKTEPTSAATDLHQRRTRDARSDSSCTAHKATPIARSR